MAVPLSSQGLSYERDSGYVEPWISTGGHGQSNKILAAQKWSQSVYGCYLSQGLSQGIPGPHTMSLT